MESLVLQVLNGLTYAGLLFVIASGFTLIFGLMRIVNLSHGVFYILGAYVGYSVQKQTDNWVLAIAAGTCAVGLTALVVQLLLRHIKGDLPQSLLTLGVATIIGDVCLWYWGGLPLFMEAPASLQHPVTAAGITYPGFRLFVLLVGVVVGTALWLLLYRTQIGRIIRAGVDNRAMVSALGIDVDRIFTLVFFLGGLLTGFSGAIGGSYLSFGPGTDFKMLTYALVVVIMGGLGSIGGSAVGALIVGLVDSFGRSYFHEVAIFLLSGTLIVVLALRPQGLFGRAE